MTAERPQVHKIPDRRHDDVQRRFNPDQFFSRIKFYVVEGAATIVFVWWVLRALLHELRQ